VARGFSVISLLAALLIGGWLLTAQQSSPSRQQTTQAVAEAQQAAAGLAFQQAEAQLEQTHSLSGTYVRTSLAGFGVTLVRADASTYCIQNATAHLSGPGGAPASGPC
jgi:Tfp pilus assembly protein PilE